MKNICFLIALFSGIQIYAQNQVLKSKSEALNLSKKVTVLLQNEKILEAFIELKKYWPVSQDQFDGFREKTIQDFSLVKQKFGQVIGIEKIKEETINDFAIRETYFIKHQNAPIRVIYSFYKNDKGWIIIGFSWDDAFTNEFK